MTRHEQLVENYENALFELLMEGVIEREGEQIEKENEQLKNDHDSFLGQRTRTDLLRFS